MRIFVAVIVLAAIIGLGYWAVMVRTGVQQQEAQPTEEIGQKIDDGGLYAVVYKNNVFEPSNLEVPVGATVVFKNEHAANIRIASNPHPIHTSFSEFDSDTLAPGESYSFIFTKSTTLNYHNHFNPGVTGKIIVK